MLIKVASTDHFETLISFFPVIAFQFLHILETFLAFSMRPFAATTLIKSNSLASKELGLNFTSKNKILKYERSLGKLKNEIS